jgi:hypothetical protein
MVDVAALDTSGGVLNGPEELLDRSSPWWGDVYGLTWAFVMVY